jgi:hypothetical protein
MVLLGHMVGSYPFSNLCLPLYHPPFTPRTSHAYTLLQRPTNSTHVPGKAKALLQAGGLYLNNARLTSLDRTLQIDDFMDGRVVILRAGREHLILELL